MDALFGLPRKKAERFELPLHGDIFFCDQNEVDEFVSLSCMLVRHLKLVNSNECFERLKFSIPSFHA